MKNLLSENEDLTLYNEDGSILYQYAKDEADKPHVATTYNENGNELTYKSSNDCYNNN